MSQFSFNRAENSGGALHMREDLDGRSLIDGALFESNVAVSGGGGAVFWSGAMEPVFNETSYQKNTALYGKDRATNGRFFSIGQVPVDLEPGKISSNAFVVYIRDFYNGACVALMRHLQNT